jgi:hypothetical protein
LFANKGKTFPTKMRTPINNIAGCRPRPVRQPSE